MFEAFARRDLDAVLELIDPAVEFHAVTGELAREGEPYRGVDGMHEYFADVGKVWQELSLDPTEFRLLGGSGSSVLVTGRVWAHGSGRVVDSSAGWIWRLREGRVTYIRVYASAAAAELAAGAEA